MLSPAYITGFDSPNLAAHAGMGIDPWLRADVIYAAGSLHEASGALAAAEAQYAAAVAVCPTHTAALIRLADLSLAAAYGVAARRESALDVLAFTSVTVTDALAVAAAAVPAAVADDAARRLARAAAYAADALRADPANHAAWAVHARVQAAKGAHSEAAAASLAALQEQDRQLLLPAVLLPLRVPLWT